MWPGSACEWAPPQLRLPSELLPPASALTTGLNWPEVAAHLVLRHLLASKNLLL